MTDLMEKYNYCGWYVGIMDKDEYANRKMETKEFGPYSKKRAIRTARFFNINPKIYGRAKNLYAVAISGREALTWKVDAMKKKAGWSHNP